MTTKNTTFKQQMHKQSTMVESVLRDEYRHSRSNFKVEHQDRLRGSVAMINRHSLANTTLLTPSVHEKHYRSLSKRFLSQKKHVNNKCIRFLTILDSVVPVNSNNIANTINAMEAKIHQVVSKSKTVWLLGAIEVEVISMRLLRDLRKRDETKDLRKLDVCETLSKSIKKKIDREADSLMLIHFHGIVTAKSEDRLIEFYN